MTPTNIQEITEKHGYSKLEYIEKFIMDFEMQYQILQKLPCITRGGMCMPFYTDKHNANRLSIDIDLLTLETVDKVNFVMNRIDSEIDEVDIEKIIPRKSYPMQNLVSYKVHYNSILGKKDWIKVDYLCEVNVPVFTKNIPANYDLFAFTIDYNMQILSRGSLIGDKLSTLSLGSIGLPDRKFAEIPKQIFDIGSQLRLITRQDVLEIFETFEQLTNFKVTVFRHDPSFTISNVVEKIEDSLKSFFKYDRTAVLLSRDEENRLGAFLGTYLGRPHPYKKTEHLGNILLILYLVKTIKGILATQIDKDSAATNFVQVTDQINSFRNMSGSEIREKSHQLLSSSIPKDMLRHQKMLRPANRIRLPADQSP